mgnify:CR=1 FL=1
MTAQRVICLALVLVIGSTVLLSSPAFSQSLIEQALRLFGIGYVVSRFGDDLNNFVTRLAGQRGVEWEGATKVVPIVSIGQGAFIGAAQVVGDPDQVDEVKAVGQLETRISSIRGRLLIPVNTTNPTRNVSRISGVGVSALLDLRI